MLIDTSQFYPTSAFGRRAFSYSAPRCWNALPRALRVIPCLETFKAHLKHHLFTNFSSYLHAVNPYTWCFSLPYTHHSSLLSMNLFFSPLTSTSLLLKFWGFWGEELHLDIGNSVLETLWFTVSGLLIVWHVNLFSFIHSSMRKVCHQAVFSVSKVA